VKATFNGTTTVYVGDYYEKTGSVWTTYYRANGEIVGYRRSTGCCFWVSGDHLHSTALVTYNSGGRQSEQRYRAWGESRYATGAMATTYHFTGQREDATIGLYFYNARYYDPALGRFTQADTVVPAAGNPQALNRYAYALNNPLRYTDPTGRFTEDELLRWGISPDMIATWKKDFAWWAIIEKAQLSDYVQAIGRYTGHEGQWRGMFSLLPSGDKQCGVQLYLATTERKRLWGTAYLGYLGPEAFRGRTQEGRTLWRYDERARAVRQVPTAKAFLSPGEQGAYWPAPYDWKRPVVRTLGEGAATLRVYTGRLDPFTPNELTGAPFGYMDITAQAFEISGYTVLPRLAGRGTQLGLAVSLASFTYNVTYDNVTESGPYNIHRYFP